MDYYKPPLPGVQSPSQNSNSPMSRTFYYVSSSIGLLSILVLIALNATNIVMVIRSDNYGESLSAQVEDIDDGVSGIYQLVMGEILPKTNLINNMVSYDLPTTLNSIYQTIYSDIRLKIINILTEVGVNIPNYLQEMMGFMREEMVAACSAKYASNSTMCPLTVNPFNTARFTKLNRDQITQCLNGGGTVSFPQNITFIDFPSFIPGPTKPGGCVRLPSFSLSKTLFSYSHTLVNEGCNDTGDADHYWSIGRVTDVNINFPYFQTITQWYFSDDLHRRSCSVATGLVGAWLGCSLATKLFTEDFADQSINDITLAYMDVYGNKVEWILTEDDIIWSEKFVAVYFSVGSGVVSGDTVYFLMYGGLANPIDGNAYCYAPGCVNPKQDACNMAASPPYLQNTPLVNAIMLFKNNATMKPQPVVFTLSPNTNWIGAEGRLMESMDPLKLFVYIRSSGWHTLPQIGIMNLADTFKISWVTTTAISRPGKYPCNASNRCPAICLTGVYNDIYPLDQNYYYGVSVFLSSQTQRVNPTAVVIRGNDIVSRSMLTTKEQQAGYSTTTCFTFNNEIWCISIVEMSPATVGSTQPVPFLYKLQTSCTRVSLPGQQENGGLGPVMDQPGSQSPFVTPCAAGKNCDSTQGITKYLNTDITKTLGKGLDTMLTTLNNSYLMKTVTQYLSSNDTTLKGLVQTLNSTGSLNSNSTLKAISEQIDTKGTTYISMTSKAVKMLTDYFNTVKNVLTNSTTSG